MNKKTKKKSKNKSKKSNKISKNRSRIFKKEFLIEENIIGLYEYLKKLKLNPKHNFISFTTKKKDNKIHFKFNSRVNNNYNSNPKWNEINCKEEESLGDLIIKTNCLIKINNIWTIADKKDLRLYKIFVKGSKNFYDYIMKIKKNKIKKEDHDLLFKKLLNNIELLKENNIEANIINHNLDVKTLHFKFIAP